MPSGSNSTEASQSIESEVKETGEETDEAKVWFGKNVLVWFGYVIVVRVCLNDSCQMTKCIALRFG
jgi:hypothetical protein